MKALPQRSGTLVKTRTTKTRTLAPKLRLWVVFDQRVKFGIGRAELLELIDQLGSIKEAVARNGMSYRAAWGYLKELEGAAGFKFLERTPGSGPRRGARLTNEAKAFLRDYRLFHRNVQRTAETAFRSLYQWRKS
jgi:molybdate transport system regulatory protein